MNAEKIAERARKIAEGVATKAGEDRNGSVFCVTYARVAHYLVRMRPIVEMLRRNDIPEFIGPLVQRGFHVVVREEDPDLVADIERNHGNPTEYGRIVMPIGFGEYSDRKDEAIRYQRVLIAEDGLKSDIVTIECPGSEEDLVALYIP